VLRRQTPSLQSRSCAQQVTGLKKGQGHASVLHKGQNNPGDAFEALQCSATRTGAACWIQQHRLGRRACVRKRLAWSGQKAKSHGVGGFANDSQSKQSTGFSCKWFSQLAWYCKMT